MNDSRLSDAYLAELVAHLRTHDFRWGVGNVEHGCEFQPGLSDEECAAVEQRFGFRFPPDLRSFLQYALPVGFGFANWRDGPEDALQSRLDWPADGMCFDVEHGVWLPEWGPRPESDEDACAIARGHVATAPRLIPIYSHRYIPDRPQEPGNPVLSVYQTDIIYSGSNLMDYFHNEFYQRPPSAAGPKPLRMSREPKQIEFWTRIIDHRGDLWDHEFERRVAEQKQAEYRSSRPVKSEHPTEPRPPGFIP